MQGIVNIRCPSKAACSGRVHEGAARDKPQISHAVTRPYSSLLARLGQALENLQPAKIFAKASIGRSSSLSAWRLTGLIGFSLTGVSRRRSCKACPRARQTHSAQTARRRQTRHTQRQRDTPTRRLFQDLSELRIGARCMFGEAIMPLSSRHTFFKLHGCKAVQKQKTEIRYPQVPTSW